MDRNEWMIDRLIVSVPYLTTTYQPSSHIEEIPLGFVESASALNEKKVFGFRMEDMVEEDCTSTKDTLVALIISIYLDKQ